MSQETILIVGAGVFGTSIAYHLSQTHPSPSSITLLDRSPSPSPFAASTDINKIIREDYTSKFYMKLAIEAMEAWKTLPCLQDGPEGPFFRRTGWAVVGEGDEVVAQIRQNFRELKGEDDRTQTIDLRDESVRARWNGLLDESDLGGLGDSYYNPDPGIADAGRAVKAMADVAMAKGVKFVSGEAVEVFLDEDGKSVAGVKTTDGALHRADKIVLATGAWTSLLMSSLEDQLGLPGPLQIESQVLASAVCVVHYRLDDEDWEKLRDMPIVIYGGLGDFQPPPRTNRLLKFTNGHSVTNHIATRTGRLISAPVDRAQSVVGKSLKAETVEGFVKKAMPKIGAREPEFWRLCWDSISPTQNHLICGHPDKRLTNLYFAVGGSFHSYKFLPTAGKYVVNVLYGKSNGTERDEAWAWKLKEERGRGAHENAYPTRELSDVEGEVVSS